MTDSASRFTASGVHTVTLRVYYEDTDTGGIVYYANYLKFAERARTEVLRDLGITQSVLMAHDGLAFAVRRCEVDYLSPAKLDDELEIRTSLRALGAASLDLDQAIYRRAAQDGEGERELARLVIRLAVIKRDGRPTRLPAQLADQLRVLLAQAAGAVDSLTPLHTTANKKRA